MSNYQNPENNPRDPSSSQAPPQDDIDKKRILIIHDRFQFKGGAERLILILANALNADLMTEFWEPESFDKSEFKGKNLYILAQGEYPKIVWRYFRAQLNFLFKARNYVRNYDTIIFSGNNCLTAAFNCKFGTKKILYCHSPVRHVFDLWKLNRSEQKKIWKKIVYYNIGAYGIKLIYWIGLKMMNITIANSRNIKNRLQNFLFHKTDHVIYPPIDLDKFEYIDQKDYYLSFGRVERLKRITDIVQAFQQIPNKKLVIVSGGPDLEKIKKMAQNYDNIKVIGWVNDQELKQYIGHCIATIYVPIDEDFGMTPVESMAAGKPCVGVDEGGLKETIIDEKTGKFIPADYKISDLINAVNWMTPERALSMREDCEQHAQKFSAERFIKEMKKIIKTLKHKNIKTLGIDASRSIDSIQKTGVELVSDQLIKHMSNDQLPITNYQLLFYTPKPINWLPTENQKILKWPFKYLWTQIRLAWELLFHPPKKFFVPVHKIPFALYIIPNTLYKYTIIHDVAFLKNPELYSIFQRWYLNFDLKRCIKKCKKIFVPTKQVKQDILNYVDIYVDKIVVIPHGYNKRNKEYGIRDMEKKKQILYIGRVEEKKNIMNLIKSFKIFNQKYPDYKLVLAGRVGMNIKCQMLNIKLLGYISDEKKSELLQESTCLVLPSKEEGFGFPILEAWDYELPVLASNIPVLQEVGEDSCYFINPDSIQNIAKGLAQITENKNLQNDLIKKGSERLKKFSWQIAAEKYLNEILQ